MARRCIVAAVAVVAVNHFCTSPAFVPPAAALRQRVEHVPLATAVGGATALLGAATAAHADAVDVVVAGRNFASVIYPALSSINWVKGTLISDWVARETMNVGPGATSQAAEALLDAALSMNPQLVTRAVAAHELALKAAYRDENLVLPEANLAEICTAIAQMLASAGPEKNQAIYNTMRSYFISDLNEEAYKLIDPSVAAAGYKAFLELAQAASAAAA